MDRIGIAQQSPANHDVKVYYNFAIAELLVREKRGDVPSHRRWGKVLLVVIAGMAVTYVSLGGYLWWAMHQPPEIFAGAVARMPQPVVFLLYPFETLWTHARAGGLNLGDRAPDFSLLKVDRSERIQFSALNLHKPVVLVFGSYT